MPSVTASLPYFTPPNDGSKPYENLNSDPLNPNASRNWVPQVYRVSIEDIRGDESSVTLDTAGFQVVKRPAKHTQFQHAAQIENEYYPESIALIKDVTGASKVVLFDHTIRRHRPGQTVSTPNNRQPISQVHVDQTQSSAEARVYRHLPPSEAPALLKKRFQILNLWRPIEAPALDWPLALCDYRSVDAKRDLVPIRLVYPDRDGETYGVMYNPSHKWKYVKGMKPDEAILIKCYDSKDDPGVAACAPHTGFEDSTTPPDAPLRQSIELRALVFYD